MDYTSIHTHKATCIGYINVQPLYSVDTPTAILQCGALLGNQSNWEYWPQRNFLYKKVVHTSSRWKCTFYAFLEICSQRIHWFAINNIHKNYIFAYGVWYEYFLFFFFLLGACRNCDKYLFVTSTENMKKYDCPICKK